MYTKIPQESPSDSGKTPKQIHLNISLIVLHISKQYATWKSKMKSKWIKDYEMYSLVILTSNSRKLFQSYQYMHRTVLAKHKKSGYEAELSVTSSLKYHLREQLSYPLG